jgi:hypothetical protein
LTSSAGVSDVFPASVMSVATCEAGINIDYAYCGVEPGTNATFLILGARRRVRRRISLAKRLLLAGRSELKAGIPPRSLPVVHPNATLWRSENRTVPRNSGLGGVAVFMR